ncbi:MAG: hypothetical protein WC798_03610 [Candidatus Paceibacterota bacterium]|jgi:cytidyltransferase-like protein
MVRKAKEGGKGETLPLVYHAAEPDPILRKAQRIIKGTAEFEDRFVPNHEELVKLVNMLRSMSCVIAFVTGVWDLIHIGHLDYCALGKKEAAKLYPGADHVILVIGVETDKLTKMRKGPKRPAVSENERVRTLAHQRWADVITLQYEPNQLFVTVPHDVRIISTSTADLPNLEMIQKQCAHIVNLPPQAETSTTARIRQFYFEGVEEAFVEIEQGIKTTLQNVRNKIGQTGGTI